MRTKNIPRRKPHASTIRSREESREEFEARLNESFSRVRRKAKGDAYAQAVKALGGKPPKSLGRPKGKLQPETRIRIVDAAALRFLGYSQSRMGPLLYPEQHVDDNSRKDVNTFWKRNKAAIESRMKTMTQVEAEQIKQSLPRIKN